MRVRTAGMVGRDAEYAMLLEAMARADSGEAQVALVRGEAGIGKTRLVRELIQRMPADTVVAVGHAVPMSGAELLYGAASDLLRSLAREVGVARVTELLGARAEALAPLVPQLVDEACSLDRLALYTVTQELLVILASDERLVLVVEDAHWADDSSWDLIAYWARTLVRGHLLLVVTSRDTEGEVDPDRLRRIGELRRLPNAVDVDLSPLSALQVAELVRGLDAGARAELVAEVQRLSTGNPLYVEELLAGAVGDPSAFLRLDLSSRLGVLSPESRAMVELAALEARTFHLGALAEVSGEQRDKVAIAVDEAAGRGLLDALPGGELRFHHELLRRAAADFMTVSARERGHRRWAGHLTRYGTGLADHVAAAGHWEAAGAVREAFDAYIAAATSATQVVASAEAASLWRAALRLVHRNPGLVSEQEHVTALAGWTVHMMGLSEIATMIEAEAAASPPRGSLRELFVTVEGLMLELFSPAATTVPASPDQLRGLLDRAEAQAPSALVLNILIDLVELCQPHNMAKEITQALDRYDAVAASLPAWLTQGNSAVLDYRLKLLNEPDDWPRRVAMAQEAVAAVAERDWASRASAHHIYAWQLFWSGDLPAAVEQERRSMALCLDSEYEGGWQAASFLAIIALRMVGELHEARALALRRQSVDHTELGLLLIALELGDPVSSEHPFGDVPWSPERLDQDDVQGELAFAHRLVEIVHTVESDPDAAATRLCHLLSSGLWYGKKLWEIVAYAASLTLLVGDAAQSELAAAIKAETARKEWQKPVPQLWRAHAEAYLARVQGTETDDTWPALAARWDAMEVPFRSAEARLRTAERLLEAGETRQAETTLAEALARTETIGARRLGEDIRTLGLRARITLPGDDARSSDADTNRRAGLTRREYEVLQLLVAGMTNRQIAGELYMSPKTASVHVSRILTKLGAANRTEVATLAIRRGLTGA